MRGNPISSRVATSSDFDEVSTTLWLAFVDDPLWSWAFPDPDDLKSVWRLYIASALRFPWVWLTGGCSAAASWIPPGERELTVDEEHRLEMLIKDLAHDHASAVLELLERFEEAHPRDRPHYHLSLLGVHPDHRGEGLGMALLSHTLARIDAEGMPAYLESSNPVNDRRYQRLGFTPHCEVSTPDGLHTVTTMWREPARQI